MTLNSNKIDVKGYQKKKKNALAFCLKPKDHMQESLKKIGEMFKERRIERNLSLKEIETATSIRMNYLKAIEEGELFNLISPVYAGGFMKQYAQYLGLDGNRILKEQSINVKGPKQEFAYGLGTLEVRPTSGQGMKWFPNFMWIGIGGVVIGAAWFFAKYLGVIS
jgi:cytoskeletal protein RodZ